jgi:quinoprotein glucose dehydrogenase
MRSPHVFPCLSACLLLAGAAVVSAAENDKHPANVSLGDDPATAMRKFSVAEGLKVTPFATEPLIENVVSFAFDEKGRAYVVETGRRRTSVYDIRKHRDWTDADLSFRTVDDRANFLKAKLVPENQALPKDILQDRNGDGRFDWRDLEIESERIKLVWDADGDGRADKSLVFADKFNSIVSGVAAGVLARQGEVYFTSIPDVWRLRDANGDDVADERERLHGGFGVHIAYGGHDMHGLKFGPDGKLYWSIADRGFGPPPDIKGLGFSTEFLKRILPDSGAVFRCDPDGANLEVVAVGLRNPQELAFDADGNLFTADNNADGGDKARWTHIVPGADYGWRYGWQHLPKLGAWNSELLWELPSRNPAAYILPPAAHIGHGPAGIAYYPGTGLPDRYAGHFFYADFPGGIRHFATRPFGASFVVDNPGDYLQNNSAGRMDGKLLWDLYPTDIDFAPGGGAYVLDWVQGWEKTGKGRLWRVGDAAVEASPQVKEVKSLLAAGFNHRKEDELAALLAHADQRVRLGAQEALVGQARGTESKKGKITRLVRGNNKVAAKLVETARSSASPMARKHALWALGQLRDVVKAEQLVELNRLTLDRDPGIRAALAKAYGDLGFEPGYSEVLTLIRDREPQVRFAATLAAARFGDARAVPPALEMLRENADRDPFLRHAGVVVLTACADEPALLKAANDGSSAVRMAALQAMRRTENAAIAQFLGDRDPRFVLEAARAINDLPIEAALPKLAALGDLKSSLAGFPADDATPILRRVANAAFRLGGDANASLLASLAGNARLGDSLRVEALEMLGEWAQPSGRDKITGLWRPLAARDGQAAKAAFGGVASSLLDKAKETPDAVRMAAMGVAGKLALTQLAPALHELAKDTAGRPDVRIAALRTLAALKDANLAGTLQLAAKDTNETVRREARKLQGSGGGAAALAALTETLEKGSLGEKQAALQGLASISGKEADTVIGRWLDQLLAGTAPKELHLDIVESAGSRSSLKDKLAAYEAKKPKDDVLAPYRETLHGGDAKAGKEIFFERAEAGCLRCHKVNGVGGEVGPELAGIGRTRTREYLLESIIAPNAQIAPGFENLLVSMKDGATYAGMLKGETAVELNLQSPEDGLLKLKKADIQARQKGLSSMLPELGTILTKRELRDLIEYLATVR